MLSGDLSRIFFIKIFPALVRTKKLDLKNLKHFVLDECDKMLAELDMRRDVQVCINLHNFMELLRISNKLKEAKQ